jgi:excisionase family DNA binding protein
MHTSTQQRLYSLHQVETALGVSRSTLYRLMERGELRSVKIGDRRLIPIIELERLCGEPALSACAQ